MKRVQGFTLLEVLVSFVLFATVGTALFQLYQSGLRNLSSSEEQTHAALLARSRLSELRAVDRLSPGNFEGNLEGSYRWKLVLSPYQADEDIRPARLPGTNRAQLFRAELRIEWGPEDRPRHYQIRTLVRAREEQPS